MARHPAQISSRLWLTSLSHRPSSGTAASVVGRGAGGEGFLVAFKVECVKRSPLTLALSPQSWGEGTKPRRTPRTK